MTREAGLERLRIRQKILLMLICLSVIPLAVATATNLITSVSSIEGLHLDRLDSLARVAADALSEIVGVHKDEIQMVSNGDTMRDYVASVVEYGKDSRQARESLAKLQELFDVFHRELAAVDDIVFLDTAGVVQAAYYPENLGRSLVEKDYFRQALYTNRLDEVFVSQVHPSLVEPDNPEMNALVLSAPVQDAQGNRVGVLAAYVNVSVLAEFIKTLSFGETGIAFVVDSDNFLLYHPEPIFYNTRTTVPKLQNLFYRYQAAQIPRTGLIDDVMGGIQRIYYYVVNAEERLTLIVRQNYDEFAEERNLPLSVSIIVFSVSVAAAVVLALRFSRRLVTPILSLKDAFLSGGQQGKYLVCKIDVKDEIGDMAAGYNTMITELERQHMLVSEERAKNEYAARYDIMTGLYNMPSFVNALNGLLRADARCAVLSLDLDSFKHVNNVHGHTVGDALLHAVARRLCDSAGGFAFCARVGGDEFLLVRQGDAASVRNAAETLLEEIRQPFTLEMRTLHVDVSIGVSFAPRDGRTALELIKCANTALYSAKKTGRNAYIEYDADIQSSSERYGKVLSALQDCVESGALRVDYQPVIAAADGRVAVFETRLRMNDKSLGPIRVEEFWPVAREDRQILRAFSKAAVRSACRFTAWLDNPEITVAVTVSMEQICDPDFIGEITAAMREEGVPEDRLALNIIEAAIGTDSDYSDRQIAQLRSLGLRVAAVEFGGGSLSIARLMERPVDVFKIGRSFVSGLPEHEKIRHIARAAIEMSHNLGIQVSAEDVETEEEYRALAQMGCDYLQGYYISRPLKEDEVADWLRTYKPDNLGGYAGA